MRSGVIRLIGYVRAYKPELKIKHYEEYRAVYCSLCRVLGKRYGMLARLTLSYDFTFFAILQLCVQNEYPCFKSKRCPFNPLKKCNFCTEQNRFLEYTADVAMLMLYHKLLDDIQDEGFLKKAAIRIIQPVFFLYYKKAKKYSPEAETIISSAMQRQREFEMSGSGNIDKAADASAASLGELVSLNFDGAQRRILRRIGYMLGRWVYIADAYFDREKDRKKGSYNPFNIEEKNERAIKEMLNVTVGEMISAYELLNVRQFNAVIRNVMFEGLHYSIETQGGKKYERSL